MSGQLLTVQVLYFRHIHLPHMIWVCLCWKDFVVILKKMDYMQNSQNQDRLKANPKFR